MALWDSQLRLAPRATRAYHDYIRAAISGSGVIRIPFSHKVVGVAESRGNRGCVCGYSLAYPWTLADRTVAIWKIFMPFILSP